MGLIGLGYIGIGASDMGAWRVFAGDVLGAQVTDGPDGSLRIRVDSRAWRIQIEPSGEDDIVYAGWEVDGPVAMSELAARLRDGGVTVETIPRLPDYAGSRR